MPSVLNPEQQKAHDKHLAYYAAFNREVFEREFAKASDAPIVLMEVATPFNDLTVFVVQDLIIDLYQNDDAEIHLLGMTGDQRKTVLQLQWENATEADPVSPRMKETLVRKLGPHSGTLYNYKVQTIKVGSQEWALR